MIECAMCWVNAGLMSDFNKTHCVIQLFSWSPLDLRNKRRVRGKRLIYTVCDCSDYQYRMLALAAQRKLFHSTLTLGLKTQCRTTKQRKQMPRSYLIGIILCLQPIDEYRKANRASADLENNVCTSHWCAWAISSGFQSSNQKYHHALLPKAAYVQLSDYVK